MDRLPRDIFSAWHYMEALQKLHEVNNNPRAGEGFLGGKMEQENFLVFDLVYNGENFGAVMWCRACGKGSDYSNKCPHCGAEQQEETI